MKVKVFDREKYLRMTEALKTRKAPNYIMEAYHYGYTDVVNAYYKNMLNKKRGRPSIINESLNIDYTELVKEDKRSFIQEARKRKDMDFLKLFYQVTNMDIMSGNRLPPKAGLGMKQAPTKGLGVKNVLRR